MSVTEYPLSKHISINFVSSFNYQNIMIVANFQFLKLYFGYLFGLVRLMIPLSMVP